MSGMKGPEVGRARVRITPDTSGFSKRLKKQLQEISKNLRVKIGAELDTDGLAAKAKAAAAAAEKATDNINVGMNLDRDNLTQKAKAAKTAAEKAVKDIEVGADFDGAELLRQTRQAVKSVEALLKNVDAGVSLDDKNTLRDARILQKKLDDILDTDVEVGVDGAGAVAKLRALRPLLNRALGKIDAEVGIDGAAAVIKARGLRAVLNRALGKIDVDTAADKSSVARTVATLRALIPARIRTRIHTDWTGSAREEALSYFKRVSSSATAAGRTISSTFAMGSAAMIALGGIAPLLIHAAQAAMQFAAAGIKAGGALALPAIATATANVLALVAAFDGFGDAIAAENVDDLNAALAGLSPSAAAAVLQIRALKDAFHMDGVQEAFWANFQDISQLSVLVEPLNAAITVTAERMGAAAQNLTTFISSGTGLAAMTQLIEGAGEGGGRLAEVVSSVAQGLIAIGGAASPVFTELISGLSTTAREWADKKAAMFESGELEAQIRGWVDTFSTGVAAIKKTLGELKGIFTGLSDAAGSVSSGKGALFIGWLEEINGWVNSFEGQNALSIFFRHTQDVMTQLSDIIFNRVLPALAGFTSNASPGIARFLENLGIAIQPLLDKLPELGGAIGGILAEIDWTQLVSFVSTLTDVFIALAPALEAIAPHIDMIIASVLGAVAAFQTVSAVMTLLSLGPVGLIIAAIGAVIAIFVVAYTESETFRKIINSVGEFIKAVFNGVVWALKSFKDQFIEDFGKIKEMLGKWVTFIKDLFVGAVKLYISIWLGLAQKILDAVVWLKDNGAQKITEFVDNIKRKFTEAKDNASVVMTRLKDTVVGKITGMRDSAVEKVDNMKTHISNAFTNAKNAASNTISGMRNSVSNTVSNMRDNVTGTAENLKNRVVTSVVNMKDRAVGSVIGLRDGIANSFWSILRTATSFASDFVGRITGGIGNLYSSGASIVQSFIDGISAAFSRAKSVVSNSLSSIRNLFPFSPAKEGPFAGRGWVLYSGLSIGEAFGDGIAKSASSARNAAGNMMSTTAAALQKGIGKPFDNVFTSIEDGIKNVATTLKTDISAAAKSAGKSLTEVAIPPATAGAAAYGRTAAMTRTMTLVPPTQATARGDDYSVKIESMVVADERDIIRKIEDSQLKQKIKRGK